MEKNVKKCFNKFESKLNKHNLSINFVLSLLLIILTFFLIVSTYESIRATNSIRDVEVEILKFRQKQIIEEKINLGEDLRFEFWAINEPILKYITNESFLDLDNSKGYYMSRLETKHLEQVLEANDFGEAGFRNTLRIVLHTFGLINDHLDMIQKASGVNDNKIRVEHILSVNEKANKLLNESDLRNINLLINITNEHVKELKNELNNLDDEISLKLSNN